MTIIKKIKELVYGGNIAALEYAYKEGLPIFYDKLETPFHLEQTKSGMSKKDIIENYAFCLSCAGLNLSSEQVREHRLKDNILTISGKTPWIIEYHCDKISDFTTRNKNAIYKVIDYINVRSCGSHVFRELKTDDNFVKEIYFYPSKRNNSSKKFNLFTHDYEKITKDAMIVSYLTYEQTEQEEYSEIYSRLRLLDLIKEVGIKGKRIGYYPSGKQKYGKIVLEFDRREIKEIEETERNYYYTKSKNKFMDRLQNYMYGRKTS